MTVRGIALLVLGGFSMLVAAAGVGLSAVFLVELWRFEQVRRRGRSPRSAFLNRLLRRLARKRIPGIAEVHHLYRAFFGVGVLRSSHLEEITEFLQAAVRRMTSAPQGPLGESLPAKIESMQQLIAANQRALEVERMCVPYSGTPEPERAVLAELLGLPAEDKTKVTAKLDALAKAIRFRYDSVERLAYESGRSIRVARWGWYGTLALAMLSAILGLMCLGL
jgi:hypothetical protein